MRARQTNRQTPVAALGPLPRVIALEDKGRILQKDTRWNPRKVLCASPGDISTARLHVVKYRRCRQSSAAAISEVVCHGLLKAMGFQTLRPVVVIVGEELSGGYQNVDDIDYRVLPGEHFGTIYESWMPLDETFIDLDTLTRPEDLVDIWVADCLMLTPDRASYGNTLLQPEAGKWRPVAADNGDCFGGSDYLSSGDFVTRCAARTPVARPTYVEPIVLTSGTATLHRVIERARAAAYQVDAVLERVPAPWWQDAGVDRHELKRAVLKRIDGLASIVDIDYWEGMTHAARGGRILEA